MSNVLFSFPHSGIFYPDGLEFQAPILEIRASEDSLVDELYSVARETSPTIKADFCRWFCDVNRSAFEVAYDDVEDAHLALDVTGNARVGIGTVHTKTFKGGKIYQSKLKFNDVLDRVNRYYRPYHQRLKSMIDESAENGSVVLVDCHSMPSFSRLGTARPDVILGNDNGRTCSPDLLEFAETQLKQLGLIVECNTIYAGGFITRHYASDHCQTLQIELNRALYLNEPTLERLPTFDLLQEKISEFCQCLIHEVSGT